MVFKVREKHSNAVDKTSFDMSKNQLKMNNRIVVRGDEDVKTVLQYFVQQSHPIFDDSMTKYTFVDGVVTGPKYLTQGHEYRYHADKHSLLTTPDSDLTENCYNKLDAVGKKIKFHFDSVGLCADDNNVINKKYGNIEVKLNAKADNNLRYQLILNLHLEKDDTTVTDTIDSVWQKLDTFQDLVSKYLPQTNWWHFFSNEAKFILDEQQSTGSAPKTSDPTTMVINKKSCQGFGALQWSDSDSPGTETTTDSQETVSESSP